MAMMINPSHELFLDTSFAIALSSSSDQLHAQAWQLSQDVERLKCRLVTTQGVLLEIGNALARRRFRASGVALLDALHRDTNLTILPLTADLYRSAFNLYIARQDKEWGLVDCASFVVMNDRGLTQALTADEHFVQAGFQALLSVGSP